VFFPKYQQGSVPIVFLFSNEFVLREKKNGFELSFGYGIISLKITFFPEDR
jgi:hypothetical protein